MVGVRVRHWVRNRFVADERGIGIVTALAVTLVVFSAGAVWTGVGLHQVDSSSYERLREQALHAAEGGVNHAISSLAEDLQYAGTTTATPLAGDNAEFEVTVTPVNPLDPDDLDRYIVAKGYAPSKAASGRRAVRQIEQQVVLDPLDGFDFALFASPGGIAGQNNLTVTGDVYSVSNVALANFSTVRGEVVTTGTFSTSNNNLVTGTVQSAGSATIDNTSTVLEGSLFSGGSVSGTGEVRGDVQAAASVSLPPANVGGVIAANSPPPPPPTLTQPTFSWDASNYPSSQSWSTVEGFTAYWDTNKATFGGAHRIVVSDVAANRVTLGSDTTLTSDTTIVSDAPITISRDIKLGAGSPPVTLTVVSLSTQAGAISLTNQQTFPSGVKVVLFAPDGSCDFDQLKTFDGVVYCNTINLSNQFTLNYSKPDVPGFGWSATSTTHFVVKVGTFREVVAT